MVLDREKNDLLVANEVKNQLIPRNKLPDLLSFGEQTLQFPLQPSCFEGSNFQVHQRTARLREAAKGGNRLTQETIQKPVEKGLPLQPQEGEKRIKIVHKIVGEDRPLFPTGHIVS